MTIALEALAQSEFEYSKNLSHSPPLEYKGLIGFKSSSSRCKKFHSPIIKNFVAFVFPICIYYWTFDQ